MLLSKKTHCAYCDSRMIRQTRKQKGTGYIWCVYSCSNEHCDRAFGTLLSMNGKRGLNSDEVYLFHIGLLGNTSPLVKDELNEDFYPEGVNI